MSFSFKAGAALLATCLMAGCALSHTARKPAAGPGAKSVRLEVPFYPDDTDQCGPAALASVLAFWGKSTEPAELRGEIYQAHLKGSLNIDLMLAAEKRGLTAEMSFGGIEELKRALDAGRPAIAFVNTRFRFFPNGHYMVITGYDEGTKQVIAHSGMQRDHRISYRKFDRQWEKTDRWTLLIQPKDPPRRKE